MKQRGILDWMGIAAVLGAMIWLLSLVRCGGWFPPAPVPVDGDACERACATGTRLGCPFAEPTPDGTTCVQVCIDTERTGWTRWHAECVAEATTCEEASRVSADGCR
jgi:hypothetical protein